MAKPPGLLLIDIQKGFQDPFWGPRNNPEAETHMELLLAGWRSRNWPVFHVQHLSVLPSSPLRPGQMGVEFMDFAHPRDQEPVFQKSVNSGFIGTLLERTLRERGVEELVVMGFTTDHCVSTTVRMAANLGFGIRISEETVVAFDRYTFDGKRFPAQVIHETALASLQHEFARVSSQASLLDELNKIYA